MQDQYLYEFRSESISIELQGISKIYESESPIVALNGINLSISPGEFLAITGPSGSGKTTIMNLIGLIDQPTVGKMTYNGRDTGSLDQLERCILRNKHIGLIFQSHFLLPEFTVEENIMMPYWISRKEVTEEVRQWLETLLRLVSLDSLRNKYPDTLSGGQAQRVAVARALINRPSIVLADEPASHLDSKLTNELFDLFDELNSCYHLTVVVITHNQQLLPRFHRVIHMQDGSIVEIDGEVIK